MLRRKRYRSASWSRSFRQKHRAAWLGLISSVIILAIVAGIFFAMIFLTREDLPYQVSLSAGTAADLPFISSGLNLKHMPDANLLNNPSFERGLSRQYLSVIDYEEFEGSSWVQTTADGRQLAATLSLDEGAVNYRLMRQDDNGLLDEVDRGSLSGLEADRLIMDQTQLLDLQIKDSPASLMHAVYLPETDEEAPLVIVDLFGTIYWEAEDGLDAYHFNSRGKLVEGSALAISDVYLEGFRDITRLDDYFYLLSLRGEVFRTPIDDPLAWTKIEAVDPLIGYDSSSKDPSDSYLNIISVGLFVVDDVLFIALSNGVFYQIKGDEVEWMRVQDFQDEEGRRPHIMLTAREMHAAFAFSDGLMLKDQYNYYYISLSKDENGFFQMDSNQRVSSRYTMSDGNSTLYSSLYQYAVLDENYLFVNDYDSFARIELIVGEDGSETLELSEVHHLNQDHESNDYSNYIVHLIPLSKDRLYIIRWSGVIELVLLTEDGYEVRTVGSLEDHLQSMDLSFEGSTISYSYYTSYIIKHRPGEGLYLTDQKMRQYWIPYGVYLALDSDGAVESEPEKRKARAGDLLLIEYEEARSQLLRHDEFDFIWQASEGVESRAYSVESDQAGQSYLSLREDSNLYQILDRQHLESRTLYTLSFDVRQSIQSDANLEIEITGAFAPIRLNIGKISQSWRRIEESFIVPKHSRSDMQSEIRFTWHGEGDLDLDNIFLAESQRGSNIYNEAAAAAIIESEPALIRFEDVAIGQNDIHNRAWLSFDSINPHSSKQSDDKNPSLEAALRLAKSSGSDVWFIFDSYARKKDAKDFLNYLAASINDELGQNRLANGTAVPWTNQFNRIFIEVRDSDAVYRTDGERAAYVDWILSGLAESPYFNNVKNRLILLDGMHYKEGLMQSAADYHVSELRIELDADNHFDDALDEAYDQFAEQRPRRFNTATPTANELMSSMNIVSGDDLTLSSQLQAADILWSAIYDIDRAASSFLFDLDFSSSDAAYHDMLLNLAGIMAPFANSRRLSIQTGAISSQTNETVYDEIYAVAFSEADRLVLILMNRGEQALSLQLNLGINRQGAQVDYYNDRAEHQTTQTYPGDHRRILIPAGGLAVLIEDSSAP